MATFTFFSPFKEALPEGLHDLDSDTLHWALTNTAPNVADDHFADITEIAAGNGSSKVIPPSSLVNSSIVGS